MLSSVNVNPPVVSRIQTTFTLNWDSFDAESGIAECVYAIGSVAGASDVQGWTRVPSPTGSGGKLRATPPESPSMAWDVTETVRAVSSGSDQVSASVESEGIRVFSGRAYIPTVRCWNHAGLREITFGPEIAVDMEGPIIGHIETLGSNGARGSSVTTSGSWLAGEWPTLQDRHSLVVSRCDAAVGSRPVVKRTPEMTPIEVSSRSSDGSVLASTPVGPFSPSGAASPGFRMKSGLYEEESDIAAWRSIGNTTMINITVGE